MRTTFLVNKDAHLCGMYRLSERLNRSSKSALIEVIDFNAAHPEVARRAEARTRKSKGPR